MKRHPSLGKILLTLFLFGATAYAESLPEQPMFAVPLEPGTRVMAGTPAYFYTDLGQVVQIASDCYYAEVPVRSGRLPSGGVYSLQIQNALFTLDYRGPFGGEFRISGDLAGGHGSVRGTLPSGSTLAWSW